ncbi:MAG: hypothetical protein ABGY24_08030, partial [bacterium]
MGGGASLMRRLIVSSLDIILVIIYIIIYITTITTINMEHVLENLWAEKSSPVSTPTAPSSGKL